MSKISNDVYDILKQLFPLDNIKKEHYVKYNGKRLFFDFYIRPQRLLVEVQGQQHIKFVGHFHNDRADFIRQKNRDDLKIAYVQENKEFSLVRFYYNENINIDLVREKIYNAIKEGFYE